MKINTIISSDSDDAKNDSLDSPNTNIHNNLVSKLRIPPLKEIKQENLSNGYIEKARSKAAKEIRKIKIKVMKILAEGKCDNFSKDPEYLKVQIEEAEQRLNEAVKYMKHKLFTQI